MDGKEQKKAKQLPNMAKKRKNNKIGPKKRKERTTAKRTFTTVYLAEPRVPGESRLRRRRRKK